MVWVIVIIVAVALVAACGQGAAPVSSAAVASAAPSPAPSVTVPPTASPTALASASAAPPPAGLIAFDRYDVPAGAEGPYLGTFITRLDGTEARKLVIPIDIQGANPVWSPDGQRLLLSIWTPPDGPGRPAVMNADGSAFGVIKPNWLGIDFACSDWSPDAMTLLCSAGDPKHTDRDGIYSIRSDGTHLTRLTHSPFHDTVGTAGECGGGDGRGVYAPDGKTFAFIRQKCGSGPDPSSDESAALEVADSDGTHLLEIVPQGGVKSHPGSQVSWSPDGTLIAFGSQDGHLFVVHPDGTGLSQIALPTQGPSHAYGPDWAPDGKQIVFSMFIDSRGATDLYRVHPDGSGLARVTDVAGAEAFARWGPALP